MRPAQRVTLLLVFLSLRAGHVAGDLIDLLHDVEDEADHSVDYDQERPSPTQRQASTIDERGAEVRCKRDSTDGSIVCDCGGNNAVSIKQLNFQPVVW